MDYWTCLPYKIIYYWKGQPLSFLPFRDDVIMFLGHEIAIRHVSHVLQHGGSQEALWKFVFLCKTATWSARIDNLQRFEDSGWGQGCFISHNKKMAVWIQNRVKGELHRQAKWTSTERFKRQQCGCCGCCRGFSPGTPVSPPPSGTFKIKIRFQIM